VDLSPFVPVPSGDTSEIVPEVAIQGAVLDGLGDMFRRDVLEFCQIGQGASHFENANNALLFA